MFFLKASVERSIERFEDKVGDYFTVSRQYRAKMRSGSIVLLDDGFELYKILNFLKEDCGVDVGVVHVRSVLCGKAAVMGMDKDGIKAVIVDSKLLGASLNGDSFIGWMTKENYDIPIFVSNCDDEKAKKIRDFTSRIGIFKTGVSLRDIVGEIGLPEKCKEYVAQLA